MPRRTTPSTTSKPAPRARRGRQAPETPAPAGPRNHVAIAEKYCRDVVAGRIIAGKWVRLACKRHLDDLARAAADPTWPYALDADKAARVCKFMERFPHIKGRWAKRTRDHRPERFVLSNWECFLTVAIFGWVFRDGQKNEHGVDVAGRRRFRQALLYVARKNGKSTWAALVGLYMLAADEEPGSEVYAGAAKNEKQAWEVFRPARLMALAVDDYRSKWAVDVLTRNLSSKRTASKFEPIIGKPGDGASPHCSIHDEYHEHKTDEQVDAMRTGMGAREQPLQLIISTAGDNLSGPCYDSWKNLERVLEGVLHNDRLFGVIYSADTVRYEWNGQVVEPDNWLDDAPIYKANPNLGISVDLGDLRAERDEARNSPRKQAVYKTKKLNLWVQSREAYFNVQKWIECGVAGLRMDEFFGCKAWVSVDLASTIDIAALEILIDLRTAPKTHKRAEALRLQGFRYVNFGAFYLPEDTVNLPENEHYRGWVTEGRLLVTDGQMIDLSLIQDDIKDLTKRFQVVGIAFDPYQANQMMVELQKDGAKVIEMRPNVLNFSAPMKTLDALILSRQIAHDCCPVMTWMVSNVVARTDAKDNVYPRKERPQNKIDGPVALIGDIAMATTGNPVPDVEAAILARGGLL
jgi:phage terminase large subunit-like protein